MTTLKPHEREDDERRDRHSLDNGHKRREQLLDTAVPHGERGEHDRQRAGEQKAAEDARGRGERRPPERGGDCQLPEPHERRKGRGEQQRAVRVEGGERHARALPHEQPENDRPKADAFFLRLHGGHLLSNGVSALPPAGGGRAPAAEKITRNRSCYPASRRRQRRGRRCRAQRDSRAAFQEVLLL